MRPDDFEAILGAAFDRIEPKDEAQREKLARLRERMKASQEELARELESIRKDAVRMTEPRHEGWREAAAERTRLAEESTDAMVAAWVEQTTTIDRIVSHLAKT